MNFAWIKPFLTRAKNMAVKNAPHILMAMGTTGSITALIFAIKATTMANQELDEAILEKTAEKNGTDLFDTSIDIDWNCVEKEKLTTKETIKICGKYYIAPVGLMLFSLGCFWGAHSIDVKRQAILAGLYSTAEEALRGYQKKVQELIGDKAEKEVRNAVAQDKAEKLPMPPTNAVPPNGNTDIWCVLNPDDDGNGQYFMSNYVKIKDAQNMANHEMIQHMYISETELFWMLDPDKRWLKPTPRSGSVGWSLDRLLELDITSCDGPNHEPIYIVQYRDKDGLDYFPEAGFAYLH